METKKTAEAVTSILNILNDLEADERRRALQTALTFFDVSLSAQSARHLPNLDNLDLSSPNPIPFSGRSDISPKEFLLQKKPKGEPQRIACLAFYLAQYRDTQHFRNSDLAGLNMEAAQPKISNMPRAAYEALRNGYLTAAGKDKRQLSAHGEQFVLALPDQTAAAMVMGTRSKARGRKPLPVRKKSSKKATVSIS